MPLAPAPQAIRNGALMALNRSGKHIYAGNVPPATVQRRRKANKAARAQRRTNRGR